MQRALQSIFRALSCQKIWLTSGNCRTIALHDLYLNDTSFYFVQLFYMQPLIASGQIIGAHGTDLSVGIRLLSGETLLQAKNSTGSRWDSNPGHCRQHSHCSKHTKPLRHLVRSNSVVGVFFLLKIKHVLIKKQSPPFSTQQFLTQTKTIRSLFTPKKGQQRLHTACYWSDINIYVLINNTNV